MRQAAICLGNIANAAHFEHMCSISFTVVTYQSQPGTTRSSCAESQTDSEGASRASEPHSQSIQIYIFLVTMFTAHKFHGPPNERLAYPVSKRTGSERPGGRANNGRSYMYDYIQITEP